MNRQNAFILIVLGVVIVLLAGLMALLGAEPLRIVLSGGMLATVVLLVTGLFSQGGQIEMSAQREAALATGHSDRITLFEKPAARPVMWLLLLLAHRVALPRLKNWTRRTLVAAGSPNLYTPEEYLAVSMLQGIGLGLLGLIGNFLISGQISPSSMLIGFVAGMSLAMYQVYAKAKARILGISRQVPYSLDLISLAMGAGATFTEAVRTVVRERSDDPFNVELRTLLAEMDLGATRRKALVNLGDRVPLESLRSIIASVVQAEELGTPLGNVLHDQATLLRQQRSVRAENAAAVASVRILIPCLLLVIAVIMTVFGPAILRIIRGGLF